MVLDSYYGDKTWSPDYLYDETIVDPTHGQIRFIPDDPVIPAFQFEAYGVNFKEQQAKWEYYETGAGVRAIRKQCDNYAELSFSVLVSDDLIDAYMYDGEPRMSLDTNPQFIQYRANFFSEFRGVKGWVVSEMFPNFVGVIEAIEYDIDEGTTDAVYKVEMRQIGTGWDYDFARLIKTNLLTAKTTKLTNTVNIQDTTDTLLAISPVNFNGTNYEEILQKAIEDAKKKAIEKATEKEKAVAKAVSVAKTSATTSNNQALRDFMSATKG